LEFDDRGTFFKNDFTQRVVDSGEIIFTDIYLQYKFRRRFLINVGLTVRQRSGWRHIPQKYKDRNIDDFSPYIRLLYPMNPNMYFRGYISMTKHNDVGRERTDYISGNLMLSYYF